MNTKKADMINILLVDDHQIIIDGLKGLLKGVKDIGTLYQAHNHQEIVEIISHSPVNLVLLDINLPDRNGFEICQELKSKPDSPKIIALTMHGNAGYINKMIRAGVDGYLSLGSKSKVVVGK